MPKPKVKKNKDDEVKVKLAENPPLSKPLLFLPTGGSRYMTGVVVDDRAEYFSLRYPALVGLDQTKTKYTFEALPFVEPGETFNLYKTALLGCMAMPKIMIAGYQEYLEGINRENAS